MPKFFVPHENIDAENIIIDGTNVNHITKVLRLKCGDRIVCCDGRGNDYCAEIALTEKQFIKCRIIEKKKADTEPDLKVALIQGIPKAAKMDYIIQKTTELGVTDIYPCRLARCVSKISDNKKIERWQKIAEEAAKQSGRGIIPKIHTPIDIDEAISIMKDADAAFTPYECEDRQCLKSVLADKDNAASAAYLIGPEGGFDIGEIEKITKSGIPTVSLGKRILRTETAGEAVLAMLMYEIGDING